MSTSPPPPSLRGSFLTLRIIVAALCMGVLVFAGVAISQHQPNRAPDQTLRLIAVAMAIGGVVLSTVVPRLLLTAGVTAQTAPETFAPGAGVRSFASDEQARLADDSPEMLTAAQKLQTATIVGCALLEGPAFFCLVVVMLGDHLAFAGVAVVLLLMLASRFPLSWEGYRAQVAAVAVKLAA